MEVDSLKDINFLTKIVKQTIEILQRNSLNSAVNLWKEELQQKKEEILIKFQKNYEDFLDILTILKNKYDINYDIEELNISLAIGFEKNKRSFSDISLKSLKNYESANSKKGKDKNEFNMQFMLYLQACSLENMLEQIQNNSVGNFSDDEKNTLSVNNAQLEKINELNEDDETQTQQSNP